MTFTTPKPKFDPYRAASLTNSVSFRREQLAVDPSNKLRKLWLKQAEQSLAEELALEYPEESTGNNAMTDISDEDLLASLLD